MPASEKASIDELAAAAKICRIANVMRPYLESTLVDQTGSKESAPRPSARSSQTSRVSATWISD